MVVVEHLTRPREVEQIVGALAPRQGEHAVEPRADPARLGVLRTAAVETVYLGLDGGAHLVGQRQRGRLGAVVARTFLALAELLADGGELLA